MTLPKVLLIHTGGTLGMPLASHDEPKTLNQIRQDFIASIGFLKKIAQIEVEMMVNLDSSDLQPSHWQALARLIDKRIKEFDGVVIIHGTDTLAWTATALSFMMTGLPAPVVLTGSQRPLKALRSDAPRNLLNAVEIAIQGPKGVLVVFGDRILHGPTVTKDSIFHFDAFRANNASTMGRIGLDIHWRQKLASRRRYWVDTRLETHLSLVTIYPGLSPDFGLSLLDQGTKALVLETFGSGNIPLEENSWAPVLQEAQNRKVPVVVSTQCRHGRMNSKLYAGARQARQLGAAFAFSMSQEAAVVKTMIILGRGTISSRFVREFERNWVGEVGASETND